MVVLYTDEYFIRRANKHQDLFDACSICLKLNNILIVI